MGLRKSKISDEEVEKAKVYSEPVPLLEKEVAPGVIATLFVEGFEVETVAEGALPRIERASIWVKLERK